MNSVMRAALHTGLIEWLTYGLWFLKRELTGQRLCDVMLWCAERGWLYSG